MDVRSNNLSTHSEPIISVQGLAKSFGGKPVLRNFNLTLRKGETLAIIGHNGSGKTTLIRLLAGLARPGAGSIRIGGVRQGLNVTSVHRTIGVVSHNTFLYQDLSPEENLRFYGRLYDVKDLDARIEALLERFALAGYRNAPVRTLSRGTQQRLSIARALLYNPNLILLDEPDSGLDPQGIDTLPNLLALTGSEERTMLLTTHNLELGLKLAGRVAILAKGRLIWEHSTDGLSVGELRKAYDSHLPKSNRIISA